MRQRGAGWNFLQRRDLTSWATHSIPQGVNKRAQGAGRRTDVRFGRDERRRYKRVQYYIQWESRHASAVIAPSLVPLLDFVIECALWSLTISSS